MALEVNSATGLPLVEGIDESVSLPHTISYVITYRARINNLQELPKDKRPPRNLWDKPYRLQQFLDEVFDTKSDTKETEYIDFDLEEVE